MNLSRLNRVLVVVMALLVLVIYWFVWGSGPSEAPEADLSDGQQESDPQGVKKGVHLGYLGVDFAVTSLTDEALSLHELRGKRVFINFWTIRCPSCEVQNRHVQELLSLIDEDDVVILSVALENDKAAVEAYLQQKEFDFAVYLPSLSQVVNTYQITHVPLNVVLDEAGIIVARYPGPNPSAAHLHELIMSATIP